MSLLITDEAIQRVKHPIFGVFWDGMIYDKIWNYYDSQKRQYVSVYLPDCQINPCTLTNSDQSAGYLTPNLADVRKYSTLKGARMAANMLVKSHTNHGYYAPPTLVTTIPPEVGGRPPLICQAIPIPGRPPKILTITGLNVEVPSEAVKGPLQCF